MEIGGPLFHVFARNIPRRNSNGLEPGGGAGGKELARAWVANIRPKTTMLAPNPPAPPPGSNDAARTFVENRSLI